MAQLVLNITFRILNIYLFLQSVFELLVSCWLAIILLVSVWLVSNVLLRLWIVVALSTFYRHSAKVGADLSAADISLTVGIMQAVCSLLGAFRKNVARLCLHQDYKMLDLL
jgi:hypothetical protein